MNLDLGIDLGDLSSAARMLQASEADPSSLAAPIPPWRIAMAMLGPAVFLFISYRLQLGLVQKLVVGLVRLTAQLLFLGFVLLNFIFSLESPMAVALYLVGMLMIAALECTTRQVRTYVGHYQDSLLACIVGGGVMGLYANFVVFHPTPWWSPRVVIPTAGMIIGNSVSGPAVAVDRLLAEVTEKRHETETRLCLGASAYEAVLPIVKISIQAALVPNLNQLAIIGLVSIPGMMTGQLLGGAEPIVAAEYQMVIMYLILTTNVLAIFASVVLAIRHAVFDRHHRLTPDRIVKRQGGKQEIDRALLAAIMSRWDWVRGGREEASAATSHRAAGDRDGYSAVAGVEMVGPATIRDADEEEVEEARPKGRATYSMHDNAPYSVLGELPALVLTLHEVNVRSAAFALFHHGDLSLSLRAGEVVTLEGPSGLGKTRLLRAIAQLDPFESGWASYGPCVLPHQPGAALNRKTQIITVPQWRERVIYVPQALPPMAGSPKELVTESFTFATRSASPATQIALQELEMRCDRLEEALRLRVGLLSEPWAQLSGGERQRAAIACALLLAATRPRHVVATTNPLTTDASSAGQEQWESLHECVLLLDEPTSACDPESALAVEGALKEAGVAMIVTTHDERQALRIANRRVILRPTSTVSSA